MGLDMYLEREHYIGGQWEHKKVSGMIEIKENNETVLELDPTTVATINVAVGSWRKSNQVHNFFVQRAQGGKDECQRSYVPNDLLIELRDKCKKILSYRDEFGADALNTTVLAEKLLPPQAGFFFGGTGIDDWYFQDLEQTINILKDVKSNEGDYYYQASW
jgi:hypothetical protein